MNLVLLPIELTERLGWTLLHFVWQAFVIAGIYGLLELSLRQRMARVRYLFACVGLVVMAVCPILTLTIVETVPPASTSAVTAAVDSAANPSPAIPILSRGQQKPTFPDDDNVGDLNRLDMSNPETVAQDAVVAVESPRELAWAHVQRSVEPWLPQLVTLWIIGVIGLSCRLLLGWRWIQKLTSSAMTSVPTEWTERLRSLMLRMGVHQSVKLVESALIDVPTVIGWIRPMILLPTAALTGLTPSQLEAILAHELAHIRRHDFLVNLVQTVIETLLFYHPAVWWISKRIREERENCCDDIAVGVCRNRLEYAKALAQMESLRGSPQLTLAADGGSLLQRIRRLMVQRSGEPRPAGWIASLSVIATTVGLISLGWIASPADSADKELPVNKLPVAHVAPAADKTENDESDPTKPSVPRSGLQQGLIQQLSSPDQSVRDQAAARLKTVFQKSPREPWQKIVDAIPKATPQADVLKMLKIDPERDLYSSIDSMMQYRLDDTWTARIWFSGDLERLNTIELQELLHRPWIEPPRNFTGTWVTYYVNGEKAHEIQYKDGKYHGTHRSYHSNNQLQVQQHFVDGQVNGEDTGYSESGKLAYRGLYENGKQVGTWTHYNEDGTVWSETKHPEPAAKRVEVKPGLTDNHVAINPPTQDKDEIAEPPKVAFDSLSIIIRNGFANKPQQRIEIKANSSCLYHIDEQIARGNVPQHPEAKLNSTVSPRRMLELNRLLAATDWLNVDSSKNGPPQLHADEVTITLLRDKQTKTVTITGPRPEPYHSLLQFLQGVAEQENLVYRLDWLTDDQDARKLTLLKVRYDIEGLAGKPGRSKPSLAVDYNRLLPTFSRFIRNPGMVDDEVLTAIRLIAFLRVEKEFEWVTRLRYDRNSNIRDIVAEALVDLGGDRVIPMLVEMAPQSEPARWGLVRMGKNAVPAIVQLIAPGRTASEIISEQMVRVYLDHRSELTGPIDARIVEAVRRGLEKAVQNQERTEYYRELLALAGKQENEAADANRNNGSATNDRPGTGPDRVSQPAGHLQGRIRLTGKFPVLEPVARGNQGRDIQQDVADESLLRSKTNGLANVFVYLKDGASVKLENTEPLTIKHQKGTFTPRAAIWRVGQPLTMLNAEPYPTNVKSRFIRNEDFNRILSGDGTITVPAAKVQENLPGLLESNVHHWMRTWLLAMDHPYAAVSDAEGHFQIPNFPAGNHQLVIWHERQGFLQKAFPVTIEAGRKTDIELEFEIAEPRWKLSGETRRQAKVYRIPNETVRQALDQSEKYRAARGPLLMRRPRRLAGLEEGDTSYPVIIASLIQDLQKGSEDREHAIVALVYLGNHALAALIEGSRSDNELIASRCCSILESRGAQASEALVAALKHPSAAVRSQAASSLGQSFQHGRANDILRALAVETDGATKGAMINALGYLRAEAAIPELEKLAKDPGYGHVATSAIENIRHSDGRAWWPPEDLADWQLCKDAHTIHGESYSPAQRARLLKLCVSPSSEVALAATLALGHLEVPEAVPVFKQSGHYYTTHALAQIATPAAIDVIVSRLNSPDYDVRRNALAGLSQGGDRWAAPLIMAMLDDPGLTIPARKDLTLNENGTSLWPEQHQAQTALFQFLWRFELPGVIFNLANEPADQFKIAAEIARIKEWWKVNGTEFLAGNPVPNPRVTSAMWSR